MKVKTLLLSGLVAGLVSWPAGLLPASTPSTSANGPLGGSQANAAEAAPAEMHPRDVQVLLYEIYNAAYQFGNAEATLHPEEWKTSVRKRALFYQRANSLRAAVDALQKPWNGFYKDPGDAALGRETLAALKKLVPEADAFTKALADTPGASSAAGYQKSAADLAELEGRLEPYVKGVEAQAKASPSAKPAEAKSQPAPPQNANVRAKTETPAAPPSPAASAAPPSPSPAASNAAPAPSPAAPAAPSAETAPAPAQPAPAPVAMSPSDVRALLYKIYEARYRITDLTGTLPLDKSKVSDQDRAALTDKANSLRSVAAAVEKPRSDFYSHPEDLDLGRATVSALHSLLVQLDDFKAALEASPGAPAAADYQQSGADLATLTHQLEPYVAYLEAKEQPPASTGTGSGGLETEVVRPAEASAPLTGNSAEKPPLDDAQLKAVLYQAYMPAFRLRDLLSQEHPDSWKASEAQRNAFHDASQALGERLAELEKWRTQFEAHPESIEAAFEVYASLGKLTEPADTVGHLVSQYQDSKLGDEYLNRAQQVANFRDQIEPYLSYLLGTYDHQTGTVERNFRACENELSYAMRPNRPAPISMKNVNPIFQGHPRRRRAKSAEHATPAHPEVKKRAEAKKPTEAKKSAKASTQKPKS